MRSSQVLKEYGSKCEGLLKLHKTRVAAERRELGSRPRFPPTRDMDPPPAKHNHPPPKHPAFKDPPEGRHFNAWTQANLQ